MKAEGGVPRWSPFLGEGKTGPSGWRPEAERAHKEHLHTAVSEKHYCILIAHFILPACESKADDLELKAASLEEVLRGFLTW